jgi:thymidylate kinase
VSGKAQRPFIVELAGLPGAGKTTLEQAIALPHISRDGLSVWKTPRSQAALKVLRLALRLARSTPPRRIALRRAFALYFMLRASAAEANALVILDQGLMQKVWSLVVERRVWPAAALEDLAKATAPFMADAVIWLDAPSELAAARIAGRTNGTSRYDNPAGQTPPLNALVQGREAYRRILALWQDHKPYRLLAIPADLPLATQREMAEAFIREWRPAPTPNPSPSKFKEGRV